MSDEDALLAAVRANPDEDTPRLMYADWLDEHAADESQRARAEFIRVQCELARLENRQSHEFDLLPQIGTGLADLQQFPARCFPE